MRRDITPPQQIEDVKRIIELMSIHSDSEDLINIGAYSAGSNPRIDEAIANIDRINDYLKQDGDVRSGYADARDRLRDLCEQLVVSDGN